MELDRLLFDFVALLVSGCITAWVFYCIGFDAGEKNCMKMQEKEFRRTLQSIKKARGIGLIEMLIICAILLIVAAMALPNAMQMQVYQDRLIAANYMKNMQVGNFNYNVAHSAYASSPTALAPLYSNASLTPASGVTTGGYLYIYTPGGSYGYTYTAQPETGRNQVWYYADNAVITSNSGSAATHSSTPVTSFPAGPVQGPPGMPGPVGPAGATGGSSGGMYNIGVAGVLPNFTSGDVFLVGATSGNISLPQPTASGQVLTFINTIGPTTTVALTGLSGVGITGRESPMFYDPHGEGYGDTTTVVSAPNPSNPSSLIWFIDQH